MPVVKPKPTVTPYKLTEADKAKMKSKKASDSVFYTLRVARADSKLIGKRAVRLFFYVSLTLCACT